IDQITGRLHGFRAPDVGQNLCHRVGVCQRVLARVELLGAQQGFGKGTCTHQRVGLLRQAVRGRRHDGAGRGRHGQRRGFGLRRAHCTTSWGAGEGSDRKLRTTATWSSQTRVGAWPTPGNST
ncbi:hypothetical protein RZS08_12255, partial [Arthrospira platensis SPKY1]|nr:hypothetical protein [Arthrospira platensis SPKY1]